ncbi:hypothetical protein ACB098_11G135500 [Castanea mollissima]
MIISFPGKKKKKKEKPSYELFRKIAAALPGMETLFLTNQEDMVDVNLKSSNAIATQSQPQLGGCAF